MKLSGMTAGPASRHIAPRAAMIVPGFTPLPVLATGRMASPAVEEACARSRATSERGRGQRSLYRRKTWIF